MFISKCVEHRMFKVTWARLCIRTYALLRARFGRTHGRVHILDVRTAECTFSDGRTRPSVRTVECTARLGARLCMHGRVHGLVYVRTDECTFRIYARTSARSSVRTVECSARLGRGSVVTRLGRRVRMDASTVRSRRMDWLHTG